MKKQLIVPSLIGKEVRGIVREELERTKPHWAIGMEDDLNNKIDGLATHIEIAKFKDEILTAIDEVLGEVKNMRGEQTLISHKLSEHSDTLENHEGRISGLESSRL